MLSLEKPCPTDPKGLQQEADQNGCGGDMLRMPLEWPNASPISCPLRS